MVENHLSEASKRTVMMFCDAMLLTLALWGSVVLRYEDIYKNVTVFWWLFPTVALVGIAALNKFGLYRSIVRYIGPSAMLPVVQGISVAAVVVMIVAYLTQVASFPRGAPIIFWFIAILLIGGSRIAVRAYFYGFQNNYLSREPIAIYGAGGSGAQLAITLLNDSKYMPVAFFDDNCALRKNIIAGIKVYDTAHISRQIESLKIKQIFLAIPSATPEQRSCIVNKLAALPLRVKTVPTFADLISGAAEVNEVREVEVSDLLGRDMVPADQTLLEASIKHKSVLVTGVGGTIGSELCRKIILQQPKRVVLYDNSEFSLYKIEHEIRTILAPEIELVVLLGSILNESFLSKVIARFAVQTIYHAAAFKHVPMVEGNVIEGVRNNVIGTWKVVRAAECNQIEELVLISSDKAVRPTNVMGATKRFAELIMQAYASQSTMTRYTMVRFGNVLRASGSVVPLFEKQVAAGGPVTVTHKDTTRYFMTTSEAAELVIQAGAMAKGGEIFVLDMGNAVRIYELAVKIIHLHGKEVKVPGIDASAAIAIDLVGLRPGEKLHEELVIGESVIGTRHPKIMQADEESLPYDLLKSICHRLERACIEADYLTIKQVLEEYVNGYTIYSDGIDPMMQLEMASQIDASNVTTLVRKVD